MARAGVVFSFLWALRGQLADIPDALSMCTSDVLDGFNYPLQSLPVSGHVRDVSPLTAFCCFAVKVNKNLAFKLHLVTSPGEVQLFLCFAEFIVLHLFAGMKSGECGSAKKKKKASKRCSNSSHLSGMWDQHVEALFPLYGTNLAEKRSPKSDFEVSRPVIKGTCSTSKHMAQWEFPGAQNTDNNTETHAN